MPKVIMTVNIGFINPYFSISARIKVPAPFDAGTFQILNRFCALFAGFVLALKLRNRCSIILGEVAFFVTFRTVRVFWVRSSHTCFCQKNHLKLSVADEQRIILVAFIREKLP